jgi:hypothetical protein
LLRDLTALQADLPATEYSVVQQARYPIIDNRKQVLAGDRLIVVSALAHTGHSRGSVSG